MLNFCFNRKKVLGIDIGASNLKIVELELHSEKPHLSNYAWMKIPDIAEKNNDIGSNFFETDIPQYIKKALKAANIKTKKTYVSIPSFGGLMTLIDFPEMAQEEMDQAIKFEAHKYIPISLDEVVTSWEIIKNGNDAGKKTQVLLVAASKRKVSSYEKIIRDAGLKSAGIEMESLAMVDSLVGNDAGKFIIVDIGYKICNIIYVEKGIIKANRNIDAGGKDITKTIARSLGITFERGEMMKNTEKNFFSSESSLHFPTLDLISGEISRIMDASLNNKEGLKVDAIILSGGSANLFGLREFFQEKFKIKTILGNPFSRISYNKKIEPALDKIKCHFSVAVGLALKGIEELRKK